MTTIQPSLAAERVSLRRQAGSGRVAARVPAQSSARPFHVHSGAVGPSQFRFRALAAEDAPHMGALFERLSPRSRYLRYLAPLRTLSKRFLEALADIDHVDREVIGAFTSGSLIGMARYVRDVTQPAQAEISVEVADDFQRMGVGERLVRELAHRARERGVTQLTASGLRENRGVLALIRRFEWPAEMTLEGPEFSVAITLPAKVA